MSKYRRNCYRTIRELLVHKPQSVTTLYILRAKNATTEAELSRIMVDVRSEI